MPDNSNTNPNPVANPVEGPTTEPPVGSANTSMPVSNIGAEGQQPSSPTPTDLPVNPLQSVPPTTANPVNIPPQPQPASTNSSSQNASPEVSNSVNPISVTTSDKRGSKFSIFIIIGAFIGLLIWGAVVYLYLDTQKLKSEAVTEKETITQELIIPTEAPIFKPEQVQIVNGSVVLNVPGSDSVTLINKKDYLTTGITGFSKIMVSPNNENMCIESWPPAPSPALYFSDISASDVVKIGDNFKGCTWSPDSKTIFYVNNAPENSVVNIYSYDVEKGIEKNLTANLQLEEEKAFELVGLSADSSKFICKYKLLSSATSEKQEVNCEVDLTTLEVADSFI